MDNTLNFDPPEGTPLGDCYQHVDALVTRNKALRIVLKNVLAMEEFRKIRGEESTMHSSIILQAKRILKTV